MLAAPTDSLPAIIDTLPDGIRALIPQAALDAVKKHASQTVTGSVSAQAPQTNIPDSLSRHIPDSLAHLSPDSLAKFASAHGVVFPEGALPPPAPAASGGQPKKAFLDHPVYGKNEDSLVYDVRNRYIFVYGKGDLTYEDNNLKADFMILNVDTKEIYATGLADTAGVVTRPEFKQAGGEYTMDTITYNLATGKAKIKGVATRDGEGFLLGRDIKKMPDNTINLAHGKYTTCDRIEHPHFYIAMTKARVIPGKKIITGPAYFVMEDVPLYFLGIPGGFFPISSGPQSGFIMPSYGEEARRGFFLRDGGYYFTFGDYADLALTGGIYTLGSWEVAGQSNYVKRYRYSGNLTTNYARTILGERNSADYQNSGNFNIRWTHRQDPKASPGSTFSASVNFSTAGYTKQGTQQISDMLNTQTNSSISYSRNWTAGSTPISLTAAFSHSQNSRDSTISFTLPNISFSVGTFAPFKRKNAIGKQQWYEKIQVSYSMQASNSVRAKERDLFTNQTLQDMTNGVLHRIPVKASFNLFGFINFTPSFNYSEAWNFKRIRYEWDPVHRRAVELPPEFGFFRMYTYSGSGSFSTKVFGMYQPRRKPGKKGWLQAVRHVMTPSVGFTLAPDFTNPRFGFVDYYQTDSTGRTARNSRFFSGSPTLSPTGAQAALTFSLSNQVEMKVASKTDSTGTKIIKLIEQFSASGNYDFLKDSMNLSNISLTLRTGNIFKNFGIQLNATWDPYMVIPVTDSRGTVRPVRVNRFNIGNGKFGRIVSTGWSFGYTFNSSKSGQPVVNDINSGRFVAAYTNPFDMSNDLDPYLRRQYMVASYYDFSIPWNFGFNYNVSYTNNGLTSTINQTLGFSGSVTLTQKWGFTFQSGYDFVARRLSTTQISLNRNLHCWSMSFQWVPMGTMKSWQFHIGVLSSMLADVKYDKQSSRYDNLRE